MRKGRNLAEQYNLKQYQQDVVLKTLLINENKLFNVTHMVLGMGSELMSELPIADKLNNETNKIEELGDIEFFATGYAYFEGIELPEKITILPTHALVGNPLCLLAFAIGNLQTIVKKEMISGVKKLDGVEVSKEKLTEIVFSIFSAIQMYANYWDLDLETVVRPANARKLNVRYSGGGFTSEGSLTRDYVAEDVALKSAIDPVTGHRKFTYEYSDNFQKDFEKEMTKIGPFENLRQTDFENNEITDYVYKNTELLTERQYKAFIKYYKDCGKSSRNSIIDKLIKNVLEQSCSCGPEESCSDCPKKDTDNTCSCVENEACSNCKPFDNVKPPFDTGQPEFDWEIIRDFEVLKISREKDYEKEMISTFVFGFTALFNKNEYLLFRYLYTDMLLCAQKANLDIDIDCMKIWKIMQESWCKDFVENIYDYEFLKRLVRIYNLGEKHMQPRMENLLTELTCNWQSYNKRNEVMHKYIWYVPNVDYLLHKYTNVNCRFVENNLRKSDLTKGIIDITVGEITDNLTEDQYTLFMVWCETEGGIEQLQYDEMREAVVAVEMNKITEHIRKVDKDE